MFKKAIKIGLGFGEKEDDIDLQTLSSIIGTNEAVIKTANMDLFKKLMKSVSVTSAILSSKSSTTNTVIEGKDIVKDVIKENNLSENSIIPELTPDQYFGFSNS